jgi:microcystin-dependent protein
MPNQEFTRNNIVATVPSLGDSANVVAAFEQYHESIAPDIDAKANKASPTFTGTATFATSSSGNVTVTTLATLPANTSIGSVSATEIGYLDGLTGSVQSQIASAVGATAPTGSIILWTTANPPSNWLICNGAPVSRTTYANLWNVLRAGTSTSPYGNGDGSTTFNLPNLVGRVPFGADGNQDEFNFLGETGGTKTLTIAIANLPAHTHSIDHNHAEVTSSTDSHSHSGTTSTAGSHTHTVSDAGDGAVTVGTSGTTTGVANNVFATRTTSSNGSHSHSFSTSTDSHSHTVNLPNFTGTSGSTGSGTALPSLPPYIVLTYIIKT